MIHEWLIALATTVALVGPAAPPPKKEEPTCLPYGYVTCSVDGRCLNHCGKWVGPQRKD